MKPENRSSTGGGTAGGVPRPTAVAAPAPSDRYSAKRAADSRSTAQPSSARNARPGGMRPAGAAVEPGRDAGARERVLEQADVLARRAQEHRHLVERHAGARLVQDAPGDLDASRPSPGAENSRTSPSASRSGGWRVAKT